MPSHPSHHSAWLEQLFFILDLKTGHVKNVLHPFLLDDVTIQQLNIVDHLLHTSIHLDMAKQWLEKQ